MHVFLLFSVNDDFEDAEEDDNMDEMEQPDDDAQIDLLQQGEGGGGQLQSKRITTPYMTKYMPTWAELSASKEQ